MEEILKQPINLLTQSLLGCLLVLAGVAIVILNKQLNAQYRAFAEELKDIAERGFTVITNNSVAMNTWVSTGDARARAQEASVQSTLLINAAMENLTEEVVGLRSNLVALTQENQRLRDALLQKGLKLS